MGGSCWVFRADRSCRFAAESAFWPNENAANDKTAHRSMHVVFITTSSGDRNVYKAVLRFVRADGIVIPGEPPNGYSANHRRSYADGNGRVEHSASGCRNCTGCTF